MDEPTEEVDRWRSDVLEFLAVRGSALFSNWTPRTNADLIREVSGLDWESILLRNVVSSPRFSRDLQRAVQVVARELVQDRNPRRNRTRGRLRGRLLARETVSARIREADPTIWVSEATQREWQTEPNGAVVGFLNHVRRGSRGINLPPSGEAAVALIDRLVATPPLRGVRPDANWQSYNMPPWLTAKNEFYRLMWTWADEFRRSRRTRDASALRELMDAGWLAAESRDRLFELFALSRTVEVLHAEVEWDSFEIQVTSQGAKKVGVSARTSSGLRGTIRFDRKPPVKGRYGELLAQYDGVDGRGRRPDLQLELEWRGATASTLIEVKATEPNSPYGRDSVVKVFGYLKDYGRLWPSGSKGMPRAMLLYAGEVGANVALADRVAKDEVLLCSPTTFGGDAAAVLRAQLAFLEVPAEATPR